VLPVSHPALVNGAIAVQTDRIAAVGERSEIRQRFQGAPVIDHPGSVLLPALINAHTHLELSNLAFLSQSKPPSTFTGWIAHMLSERERTGFTGPAVQEAALDALKDQHRSGVIAIADITNSGLTRNLTTHFAGQLFCFKEFLGLNFAGVAPSLEALKDEEDHFCTAHAPYSTHADLLQALKKRAVKFHHVFPIHVAEPAAESEMMCRGRGEIPDFLKQRGFWDGSFQPTGIDKSGSVQYLHQLKLLDSRTLCIHCIHVTAAEIDILAETGSKVCLCPGSNRYLNVGRPPVNAYLAKGILPGLGTDSLASNPELSIWREMQMLAEDHPAVEHADILAMATRGGAAALGLETEIGSLGPGKQADFLAVNLPAAMDDAAQVYSYLVTTGSSIDPAWITC
jgi:cytosine/adenosine deaminase-related metal-dependent hydrolase